MGSIYMLTSPSGKHYIGQHHTNNVEERMRTHVSGFNTYVKNLAELKQLQEDYPDMEHEPIKNKGCIALYQAFMKYEPENFEYEVLQENVPAKDLNETEDSYIMKFNTLAPNGYNLRLNNNNGAIRTLSEETRKRFSDASVLKNKKYMNKYRKYKDELKDMPQYVIFYKDKQGYRGYKIQDHPKCSSKSFTSKTTPLEDLKQECLDFLNSLQDTYVKEERSLPVGITKPKNRAGYVAKFKKNKVVYKRYFNDSTDAEENLKNAITWLDTKKAEVNSAQEPDNEE